MREAGIETRPVFHPVHTMPMYARGQTGLDVSVALAARGARPTRRALAGAPGGAGATAETADTVPS